MIKNDVKNWVNYKFKRYRYENNLKKIKNMIKSKLIYGPRILMAYLKIYELIKKLFIIQFELGIEVLIPDELS